MKTKYKTLFTFTLAALLFGMFAASCNTVRGVGRDVQRTGEHIQHGSR